MAKAWRIAGDLYARQRDCSILNAMIYHFGAFELDIARVELRRAGSPCPLEPQVFALLAFLVEHRERVVSKDEIFEKVWDGRVVTDSALTSRVKLARKALGDNGKAQKFIRTVHGMGFRFVADVRVQRDPVLAVLPANPPADDTLGLGTTADTDTRPSIAVLPFQCIGAAGAYDNIAQGLPHELITELARLRWLFVIARGSSFRLGGQDLEPQAVGRTLGVQYILSGTVEVTGQQLVITTELVDALGGDVVWGERYKGYVDEVHAVRDEIRAKILASLEIQIPLHEATRARLMNSDNLSAWSAYHLGLQHLYRFNATDNSTATALFEHAVREDPDFARAHAGLSFVHFQTAFMHLTNNIGGEVALARDSAQRGLDIDPLDPFVNFTMGRSFWLETDLERARSWLERAIALCPNYAQGIYALAWTNTIAGVQADGRGQIDQAMRLSPLDPLYYAMLGARGFTHIAHEEYSEAIEWTDRAAQSPGAHVFMALLAAAAQQLAGNPLRAQAWAAEVRERGPQIRSNDFFRNYPITAEPMRARVAAALRQLGF
ncbi:MAG: winged helix-turn-helix domain-containing protein [Pseudomonadaceae bacterium]|nr:winged helix-turn-helix domain-containing protein [Pseudomonadaceae bacterium]